MTFEERIFSTLVEEILKTRQALNAAARGLEIKISKRGLATIFKLTLTAGDGVDGTVKITVGNGSLFAEAEVLDLESLAGRCLVEFVRQINGPRELWPSGGDEWDYAPEAERCIENAFQGLTSWLGG